MTAYRKSMVYGLEGLDGKCTDSYPYAAGLGYHTEEVGGESQAVQNSFIAPPPNSFFTYTSSRNVSILYSQGTKFWDTALYGQFSGSWSWSFILDYEYPEPLLLSFEKVTYSDYVTIGDGNDAVSVPTKMKLEKSVGSRVKSFCARVRTINTPAGGSKNDTVLLKGCVVRDISFSRAGAGAQVQVQMSGFYADEEMVCDAIVEPTTDFQTHNGDPVEYACLFVGSDEVGYTEQISVSINNGATPGYVTCTGFPQYFNETASSFRFGTTAYSNEPERYKTKVYSGGKDNTHRKPMGKDLAPLNEMSIKCYTYSNHNEASDANAPGYDVPIAANPSANPPVSAVSGMDNSAKSITFTMEKVVIKSYTSEKGDGQKLMDTISSVEVSNLYLTVVNHANPGVIDLCTGGKNPIRVPAYTEGGSTTPTDTIPPTPSP